MLEYGPVITAYVLFVAALLGAVMGSFVNCWAWRYLQGESIMRGRSHCTTCGHDLAARDLVPVFSWLASKGRCRYCGAKVSARYPATELVSAVVFVAITATYGLSVETVELLAFASVLLFLSLTDLDDFLIPNGAIIAAIAIRIAYLVYAWATHALEPPDIAYYFASAIGMGAVLLVVVLVADRVLGRESMGGGDLKLYAVAGLYFGWQQGMFLVVVSCLIGIVVGLVRAQRDGTMRADVAKGPTGSDASASAKSKPFPFGPSIAAACVVTMIVGKPFISWYLALL